MKQKEKRKEHKQRGQKSEFYNLNKRPDKKAKIEKIVD